MRKYRFGIDNCEDFDLEEDPSLQECCYEDPYREQTSFLREECCYQQKPCFRPSYNAIPCYGCPKPVPPIITPEPRFIQLFDPLFVNEIIQGTTFLNISNEGIRPEITTGGFELITTNNTNDTLVIEAPGTYQVSISLLTTISIIGQPVPGTTVILIFDLVNFIQEILAPLVFRTNITEDSSSIIQSMLSTSVLVNTVGPSRFLSLRLNQLIVGGADNINVGVQDIIFIANKLRPLIEC